MKPIRGITALTLLCLTTVLAIGEVRPEQRTWMVDGVQREALLYGMDAGQPVPRPLVIVFHGHGGTMRQAARSFHLQELWPEALVVYPQGLPTKGKLVDPEGHSPGWQVTAGDQQDRDLKFFDALFDTLQKEGRVDLSQVYVAGHSNGGAFVLLLWAQRSDRIAAYSVSAAVMPGPYAGLKPAHVFFIAGEKDNLVKYSWQQQMFGALCRHFNCGPLRHDNKGCAIAESKTGAQLVAYVHPGEHPFPPEVPRLIVEYFRTAKAQ